MMVTMIMDSKVEGGEGYRKVQGGGGKWSETLRMVGLSICG